jgi:Flp pilus assembly protein TadG
MTHPPTDRERQSSTMTRTIHTAPHRSAGGERGAAAVLVGVSLLALMGFAALAIDAGFGYSERRGTQNAADNAALAAAWEDCNPATAGSPDPAVAARATAADNGYDHAAADVTVDVADLGDGQWQVDITDVNDATFGGATPYAADEVTVLSSSVAECETIPFLGGYAIFAGGPASCNGGVELDLSGASKIINGGIHSNGELKITGSSTDVNGQVTYVGSSNYSPSTQIFSELAYPVDITIAEYRPGGSRALAHNSSVPANDHYFNTTTINNNWMKNNGYANSLGGQKIEVVKSGVYYASGSIDLKQVSMASGVKATFVAEGQIAITGESDFAGYDPVIGGANDPGVLFFSNYQAPPSGPTCTGNAINVSSSSVSWTGVIFAPYGAVTPSFSSATSLNGSIFAYTVNVSGSDFQISWQDNPNATPDFSVNLLK